MTLLITIICAVVCTVIWYANSKAREMKIGTLCLMYWGAGLMWLVDAVVEYSEMKADYFIPETADMINDSFLGLSAAALGAVIWLVILLVKDPHSVVKSALVKKS